MLFGLCVVLSAGAPRLRGSLLQDLLFAWAPRVCGTYLQDSLQVHPCKLGRDIHVACMVKPVFFRDD